MARARTHIRQNAAYVQDMLQIPYPSESKSVGWGLGLGAGAGWGLELKGDSALIRKRFAATLMARFQ